MRVWAILRTERDINGVRWSQACDLRDRNRTNRKPDPVSYWSLLLALLAHLISIT
jgi:hypothetical protein